MLVPKLLEIYHLYAIGVLNAVYVGHIAFLNTFRFI